MRKAQRNNPSGRLIMEGQVLELGVVRTKEGHYERFQLLAMKGVRPGAIVRVFAIEPNTENGNDGEPETVSERDGTD